MIDGAARFLTINPAAERVFGTRGTSTAGGRRRVGPTGGGVRIDVADKGVGIFWGDIPRLFRRFGQIDSALTREQGGTGMGLYICRRLVEVHGGRIWVDSHLGKGSVFHVALPRRSPEPERVTGRPALSAAGLPAPSA